MGFFSKIFKAVDLPSKLVRRGASKAVGKAFGDLMSGFSQDSAPDTTAEEEAAARLAETEKEKQARLEAMQGLTQTGPLGAGAPQVKRPGITGV